MSFNINKKMKIKIEIEIDELDEVLAHESISIENAVDYLYKAEKVISQKITNVVNDFIEDEE